MIFFTSPQSKGQPKAIRREDENGKLWALASQYVHVLWQTLHHKLMILKSTVIMLKVKVVNADAAPKGQYIEHSEKPRKSHCNVSL